MFTIKKVDVLFVNKHGRVKPRPAESSPKEAGNGHREKPEKRRDERG
jgi:hypothetical protein